MILSIESDLPTFKTATFHVGLNVILADKTAVSGTRRTRNSAGKTSLIEIINFIFGSRADQDALVRQPALAEHFFRATIKVGSDVFAVERKGSDASKIFIDADVSKKLGLITIHDKKSRRFCITNEQWKEFLGSQMFALPFPRANTEFERSFTPSFRSLFSYFARRNNSKGFVGIEKSSVAQGKWDYQVNLSYLLGLDWHLPFELQNVRQREASLKELKKAAQGGTLGAVIGTVAELRPMVAVADAKAVALRDQLSKFTVVEAYRELSDRAARAKAEMQAIERRAVSLKETRDYLQEALSSEHAPHREDITRLYDAVGIELPEQVKRRFDQVEAFHKSVVENRKQHLQDEIASVETAIVTSDKRRSELDIERSDILRHLEGKGALEDFVRLQRELADLEAHAAALRERFKAAETLESEKTQLDIERASLQKLLQADHKTHGKQLDEMTIIIDAAIAALYEDREGGFVVDATENGPEFRLSIQGDRGGGIAHMEIFCFDHALFTLLLRRKLGPGFLIHDSHLFDGVDQRQIASALSLGAKTAHQFGAQYIVSMNSDIFQSLPLPPEIDRQKVVASPRLSDADDASGLFGFQF